MTKSRHLITPRGEQLRYFEEHVMEPSDGCRIWPYPLNSSGYGRITVDGRLQTVHALTCERWRGPRPFPKAEAAHSCGVSSCWAGEHLRWATSKENHADKIDHGTVNRGEANGRAKLTVDDVKTIKRLRSEGRSVSELAAEYGVSRTHLHAVLSGRKWSWL